MAKIIVECIDPNDLEAIEQVSEQIAGKCNVTHYRTSEAMKKSGAAKSTFDSAKQISEATGEPLGTVRDRISKGEKKVVGVQQPPPTPSNHTEITNNQTISENQTRPLAKDGTHRGGHREGAGRSIKHIPTKQEEKEKIISDDFQTAFELMLREIKNAKKLKWQTTSKEAAIKSVSVLYDVITI